MVTETVEKMEDDHRELRIKYFQVKEECDDLKEKMKFFTKVCEGLIIIEHNDNH